MEQTQKNSDFASTLITVFTVQAALTANKFIYYFKRIPLLGRLAGDSIYADGSLKTALCGVFAILKQLMRFFYKALYIGLVAYLPAFLMLENAAKATRQGLFVWVLLMMSIGGAVLNAHTANTDFLRYTCIKLLGMEPGRFIYSTVVFDHLTDLVFFLPASLIFGLLAGLPLVSCLVLPVMVVGLHLAGEALHLFLFDKCGIVLVKKYLITWGFAGLCLLLGYLPLLFPGLAPLVRHHWAVSLPGALLFLVLGGLGLHYLKTYSVYTGLSQATTNLSEAVLDPKKAQSQALFAGVKLKDEDLRQESLQPGRFAHRHGFDYLNALFFDRHRRMVLKPILIELAVIGALFLLLVLLCILSPQLAYTGAAAVTGILPVFVFCMYMATSQCERITRAMFYNCDIALLRYSFYRSRRAVLETFRRRMLYVGGFNLLVGAAMCAAVGGFVALAGYHWPPDQMIPFMLSLLCLSLFFAVHHLFCYYIFQPYTTDLNMKNPFYKLVNMAVYLLCYLCLQIKVEPRGFAVVVSLSTVVYMTVALLLVYRFAPKTFRVK